MQPCKHLIRNPALPYTATLAACTCFFFDGNAWPVVAASSDYLVWVSWKKSSSLRIHTIFAFGSFVAGARCPDRDAPTCFRSSFDATHAHCCFACCCTQLKPQVAVRSHPTQPPTTTGTHRCCSRPTCQAGRPGAARPGARRGIAQRGVQRLAAGRPGSLTRVSALTLQSQGGARGGFIFG